MSNGNRPVLRAGKVPVSGERAVFEVRGGLSRAHFVGRADLGALVAGRFEGAQPELSAHGGFVQMRYRVRALDAVHAALFGDDLRADVALHAAPSWDVRIQGGISELDADLRALTLSSLAIHGGASEVVVHLPRPQGRVVVEVRGGVSSAVFMRPAGVPVVFTVTGGASQLVLDDQRLGAIGGHSRLASSSSSSHDVYEIVVRGGASDVRIGRTGLDAPEPRDVARGDDLVAKSGDEVEEGHQEVEELLDDVKRFDRALASGASM
jgi:hypothetical protein